MKNLFLFGSGTNPDIIFGKYSADGVNPEISEVTGTEVFKTLENTRINKYELWFTTTIAFIPYSGQSVFITDTSGNVTHNGNLLTKGNTTVNGNATINKDVTVDMNLQVKGDIIAGGNVTIKGNTKIDKDLRVEGDLYVRGQNITAIIDQLNATTTAVTNAVSSATSTTQNSTTTTGSSTTNITQIVQPIYDNVKIDFVNTSNETNNRGSINKITFNGLVANVANGFQVGGMRSGEYVQDDKRVGIEMILTSTTAGSEAGDDTGYRINNREQFGGGFTERITLTFEKPVREFSIKAVDVNKTTLLGSYRAVFKYVSGMTEEVNFTTQPNVYEKTVNKSSSQSNGDISEVRLIPNTDSNEGIAFITYTNLFWK